MNSARLPRRLSPILLALSLGSCGAGTAAVLGSGGTDASDEDSLPVVSGISISDREVAPARVEVVLTDVDGPSPAVLGLRYSVAGGPELPMTLLSSAAPGATVSGPEVTTGLVGSSGGQPFTFFWDFEADLGSSELNTQIAVVAQVGASKFVKDDAVGNSQPDVTIESVTEGAGDLTVQFRAEEPDLLGLPPDIDVTQQVFIRPEVFIDGSFVPATPAGLPGLEGLELGFDVDGFIQVQDGAGTPVDFQLYTVNASAAYLWDSGADLPERSGFFRFRLTVKDEFAVAGDGLSSFEELVFVDNADLAATIDTGAVAAGGDRRGVVTVPLVFTNTSNDSARFVLQATTDGVFADLPSQATSSGVAAELEAILADPSQRAALGIVEQLPFQVDVPIALSGGSSTVSCSRLATDASWFPSVPRLGDSTASLLDGSSLDLLRPSDRLRPADADWPAGLAATVVDLLPVDGGARAIALFQVGGAWSVSLLDLATGDQVNPSAALAPVGTPRELSLSPDGRSVIVVAEVGPEYEFTRIDAPLPGAGGWVASAESWRAPVPGEFRGAAALGSRTVLVASPTAISTASLTAGGATAQGRIVDGLQEVRDVAVDPRDPRRVLVACGASGAGDGFLLQLDVDRGTSTRRSYATIDDPVAVAVGDDRQGLLVLERQGGDTRLIEVGYRHGRLEPASTVVQGALPIGATHLRTGSRAVRLLVADSGPTRAFAAGGVELRRVIDRYDPQDGVLTLVAPLPPAVAGLPPGTPRQARLTSPNAERLVWLPPGRTALRWATDRFWPKGPVSLRVTAFGADYQGDASIASFEIASDFSTEPDEGVLSVGNFDGFPTAVTAPDLNGDGRPDLAFLRSASDRLQSSLFVSPQFFQNQGPYDPSGPGALGLGTSELLVADVAGDGDDELILACDTCAQALRVVDLIGSQLTEIDSISLPSGGGTRAAAIADMDGDSVADLVAYDPAGGQVMIHRGTGFAGNPFVSSIPMVAAPAPSSASDGYALVVTDVDGDGVRDLVVGADGDLQLLLGAVATPGSWIPEAVGATTAVGGAGDLVRLAAADVDGDGTPEIAATFAGGGQHVVLFDFDPSADQLVELGGLGGGGDSSTTSFLSVADVDRDGRGDIATGGFGALSGVEVYRDPLSFPESADLAAGAGPESVPVQPQPVAFQFEDWAGNGRADVLSGEFFGGGTSKPSLATQDSPGDFREGEVLELGQLLTRESITFGDVNGDLLLDAVGVPPDDPHVIHVHLQDAPGKFALSPIAALTPPSQPTLGGMAVRRPQRAVVADLNSDGRIDILASTEVRYDGPIAGPVDCGGGVVLLASDVRETTFVLFEGLPDGTIDPVGKPFGFDLDGGVQIASQAEFSSGFPNGNAVRSWEVGDVDGDGLPDLLVAHSRPKQVLDCNASVLGQIALLHLSEPDQTGEDYRGSVLLYRNQGGADPFGAPPEEIIAPQQVTTFRFRDVNGDGSFDVMGHRFTSGGSTAVGAPVTFQSMDVFLASGSTSGPTYPSTPTVEVAMPPDAEVTGIKFDSRLIVADWTQNGLIDLIATGSPPSGGTLSSLQRLWVLDGEQMQGASAGVGAWEELRFTLIDNLVASSAFPITAADADTDGVVDLTVGLPDGSLPGGFTPAAGAILFRSGTEIDAVVVAPTSQGNEYLALPTLATLEEPTLLDLDQDGSLELLGLTTFPGIFDPGAELRQVVIVFDDR